MTRTCQCQAHRVRTATHTLFQKFTDLQATKAQIVTCEEVTDEEGDLRYQRNAGFLPVDGEATLEEVNMAKILEIAALETDPFVGLYRIDTDSDTDNESDADLKEPEDGSGLGGLHGNGYHCQPPTVAVAQLALEDLTNLLHPPRQKRNGYKNGYTQRKTTLDPITLMRLEDVRNFLCWYCDFDTNGNPKNPSAGMWMKALADIAGCRSKGYWQARTLRASARAYVQT